jgi:Mn-dependent DtxR family transcriptional regulator
MGAKRGLKRGREDYLRAIYELGLGVNNNIKSVEIARVLEVSKPSVSEMLRKLSVNGLVKLEPYSKVILTSKGMKVGEFLHERHKTIKNFLKKIMKYDDVEVYDEAHELEHAFSDDSIHALNDFVLGRRLGVEIPTYVY